MGGGSVPIPSVSEVRGQYIYLLQADQAMYDDVAKRAAVIEFLVAHGIDEERFLIGNAIHVRRLDDGELWVDTWQAVAGYPLCEHCPACVKQERVVVRLAAAVPEFADGPFGRV